MPLPKANISTNKMGAASRFRATLYVVLENFRSKTGSFENLGPKQGPKTGFCDFLLKQGPRQGQIDKNGRDLDSKNRPIAGAGGTVR